MNLLPLLLMVLFTGGSILAVYLALIRPALIFWLRRAAIAVRDDLKLGVLTGEIGEHEKAVRPTMQKIDGLLFGCEHLGVIAVATVLRLNASLNLEAERDSQIGIDAGSAMKEIIRRADMLVVAAIVANSPFFWLALPPLYALGTLTGKITRWINSVSLAAKDGAHHGHNGGLAPA